MDTHLDRSAYVESLLHRLRRQYVERTPLPAGQGQETEALTFERLRQLCQLVLSEGYGEQAEG
jgi:hypothetical protein